MRGYGPLPKLSSRSLIPLLSAIVVIVACLGAKAASQTIWQIGKFDHSSEEFNQSWRDWALSGGTQPESTKAYIIGKSSPKPDWCASQPGSGNEKPAVAPIPIGSNSI